MQDLLVCTVAPPGSCENMNRIVDISLTDSCMYIANTSQNTFGGHGKYKQLVKFLDCVHLYLSAFFNNYELLIKSHDA